MAQVEDYKNFVDDFVDESGVDQNEASVGGGGYTPPEEGRAFARIVEYVELGKHFGTYQGKQKPKPDDLARVVLELSGKKYPPHKAEDGTETPQKLFLELTISNNEKSRFYKLFRALNGMYGDKYKHFAQMAADNLAFIVNISHRHSGEGDNKRTYANVWKDGAWQVQSLQKFDEDGEPAGMFSVAPAMSPTVIFLFNRPRLVDWNKLFIEGTRDDGQSRNWIQETIMKAANFEGSPLQAMLVDLPLEDVPGMKEPAEKPKSGKAKAAQKAADPLDDI